MSSIILAATNVFDSPLKVEILMVAGGGGGGTGDDTGGGGGGGGGGAMFYTSDPINVSSKTLTIAVGNGGAGAPGNHAGGTWPGTSGGATTLQIGSGTTITAPGGGGGSLAGGSSGGSTRAVGSIAATANNTSYSGWNQYGNAGGGNGGVNDVGGGGGGGAGGAGGAAGNSSPNGFGGSSRAWPVDNIQYAGGGGGGRDIDNSGNYTRTGGGAGAGNGGNNANGANASIANRGSGGGAGSTDSIGGQNRGSLYTGGNGSKGIVAIWVPKTNYASYDTSGLTVTRNGNFTRVDTGESGTLLTVTNHSGSNGTITMNNNTLTPVTQGLIVHLDAGVSVSYPGSGSTWYDLTSNGNDFTLFNSPTYSSANGGKFQFNGSTQYATGGPDLSTSDCTVVTIHRYATNSNSARGRVTASAADNWLLGLHGGYMDRYFAGTGWIISSSTPADTDWHIHAATEDYSGDTRVLYDNNVAPSGQTPSGGSTGPNGIQLARWGSGEYSDCEVAALLVYDRVLSTTELTTIYNFYKDRFGLS